MIEGRTRGTIVILVIIVDPAVDLNFSLLVILDPAVDRLAPMEQRSISVSMRSNATSTNDMTRWKEIWQILTTKSVSFWSLVNLISVSRVKKQFKLKYFSNLDYIFYLTMLLLWLALL